jgi:hypothetical protein
MRSHDVWWLRALRFFTLGLLLLFTYVFSVAFMQFSRGTVLEQKFFSSMGTAIWTLSLGAGKMQVLAILSINIWT